MKYYYNVLILLLLPLLGFSDDRLTLFGRGMYPGDDSTYASLRSSGFGTIVLSSFYIRANGDLFSGDDGKAPIIHAGKYVGNKDWLKRVASLKKAGKRIEILLEGRWFNQPPNTYDYILDWTAADSAGKSYPGVIFGTMPGSTLYGIARICRDELGANALCIDDESVYNSASIVNMGQMLGKMKMHMTLCPFTRAAYWKEILAGSEKRVVDAIYLQCYDGGSRNVPARWDSSLATTLPIDPIFLCRGSYDTCGASHNGKTPAEIKAEMARFRKGYPALSGGAIWQVADLKNYVRMGCAVKDPASGDARSMEQYLQELREALEMRAKGEK